MTSGLEGVRGLAERVLYADTHALVSSDEAGEFICLPPWLWLEIRDTAKAALPTPPAATRGDVPYDRELIARMLERCEHVDYSCAAMVEQARLLRAADNASARGDTVSRNAGDAEVRARELLAVEYEASGLPYSAQAIRNGETNFEIRNATRAIVAALSQQPEAKPEARDGGESPMTEAEVRQWIDACNHEPARQVLRDYLRLRTALPSAPVGDVGEIMHNALCRIALGQEPAQTIADDAIAEARKAALTQQPEARGVVDEAEVFRLAAGSHYGTEPNSYWDMDRDALLAFARALTEARNG